MTAFDKDDRVHETGGSEGASAKAVVVVPVLPAFHLRKAGETAKPHLARTPEARMEEAVGLAQAIDLEIAHREIVTVSQPRPATLMGSGKIAGLAEKAAEHGAELVVIDHPLTPVQQRNLERELKAKVLDRTGLILEIFGRRARTKEGVLQVELAHLQYQKGRLVRSWTHLERQRGGAGFMGGPGETQIEADRRILQDKIIKLKRELDIVRRTRDLHRAKRKKAPYPVVAIVGYTNAGKSTLFNRMTGASVMAEDMLFATLDPTLRRIRMPHGETVILSDTVGFISDLPTHLVAAFRATLEEVVEADLVAHLRDIADPDTAAQAEDVIRILADLGVDARDRSHVLEVWNKIDMLDEASRERLSGEAAAMPDAERPIVLSALTGEGVHRLVDEIEKRIAGILTPLEIVVGPEQLKQIDWIYRHSSVLTREDRDDGSVALTLMAPESARNEILDRIHGRKTARKD